MIPKKKRENYVLDSMPRYNRIQRLTFKTCRLETSDYIKLFFLKKKKNLIRRLFDFEHKVVHSINTNMDRKGGIYCIYFTFNLEQKSKQCKIRQK